MKAVAKDRKSWFSMPRVPTSWWRYSMPTTSPTGGDNDNPTNQEKTPERAQSEILEISSPLPQNRTDTRTSPIRDVIIDDPEYANTVTASITIDGGGDANAITERPGNEVTETTVIIAEAPPVTIEQRLSELGMSILRDVPNISFSFFPDNDNIFSSTRNASTQNSLERAAVQLGSNLSNDGGNNGNVTSAEESSDTHMASDRIESTGDKHVINLEVRGDVCDGSSSENTARELRLSSASSDYLSFNDSSIVTDLGNEECLFKNDTKRYESEYSIFIGKSVEISDENVLNGGGDLSANSDKVPTNSNDVNVVVESSYASPRNSAVSVSVQDLSKAADESVEVVVGKLRLQQAGDLYTQIKPRLSELTNKQLNESPSLDPHDRLFKSNDKKYTSKSTKSLNEISNRARDIHFKSKSQNALHKSISKSESPPKLSLRNGSIKLSDKFEDSPINPCRKLSTASKANSTPYQNHERPPGPPPLPPVDWTDASHESSSVYDQGSGNTTVISSPSTIPDDDINYEDVEEFDYCHQREKGRRVTLSRAAKKGPGLVRVRSRLGRVVRAVSGWWSEERVKLGEVIQKHAHAQAVGVTETEKNMCDKDLEEGDGEGVEEEDGTVDEVDGKERDGNGEGSVEGSATGTPIMAVKRRVRRMGRPTSRTRLSMRSRYFPEGQNGFEELRRYIKQGGDFCKDLSAILQERSEAESQYAKSLSKLSSKLVKASKDSVGTVNQAWQRAGTQMEAQSEIHRAFATALSEEVVKPLRQMVESQHRLRKTVEAAVDKTGKSLSEWRAAETKSKKQSFVSARENEKLQDAMLDVRLAGGRAGSVHALHHAQPGQKGAVSDKESAKLESKRRKAEDAVKKADVEYFTFCIRAERSRLEWETAVIRGSHCFQAIEEERLQNLKDIASCYLQNLQEMGPKMVESTDQLCEPVHGCDVSRDIQTVVSIKGTGQPIPEQLLPDFYAEHVTLAMNRDRRRGALVKLLQLVRQDIDRERRGKQGVENLARALQETPTFGAEDSRQNVTEKLHHMRSMLTYLEAVRYKVQSALAELDGRARGPHPLASHIQVTRDRQGLQQSVLKVPPWVRKESIDRMAGDSPDWTDRGAADGNSVQPDSDFDEFSSQGSDKDYQSSILTYPVISECSESTTSCGTTGQCKALYEYSANLYDELNLSPGDIINIHDKQPDGWWLGELNGVVGIFPATYVEEIK